MSAGGEPNKFLSVSPGLLVFDLDGTLIDSRLDLANAVNATLVHCGRHRLDNEAISSFIGDGAAALVRRSLQATGEADGSQVATALPFFLDYYRHHLLDHTHLYPGVLEALTAIRHHAPHLPMAVLTNKPVGPSRRICDGLGLSSFFFANYGGDSFPTKKPDPAGLLHLIAEAPHSCGALTAAKTVMIGDSDVDVKTARAAGAVSLGCEFGYAKDALLAAHPDLSVTAPAEWPAAFGFSDQFCGR